MDFMAVIPTCRCAMLVYLFKHIDRILYILTFQSTYRLTVLPLAHAHPPCVTAAFHVWYAVHLHSLQIVCPIQHIPSSLRWGRHRNSDWISRWTACCLILRLKSFTTLKYFLFLVTLRGCLTFTWWMLCELFDTVAHLSAEGRKFLFDPSLSATGMAT